MHSHQSWLQTKQKHISATDYATWIMAENEKKWLSSPFELVMAKMFMTFEQYLTWQDLIKTASMQAGKEAESEIINLAQNHLQCGEIEPNSEFILHPNADLKAGSTPDGFIVNHGKRQATVEVKRTSQEYLLDLEKGYTHQVKFQIFTTGLDRGLLYITKPNPETKVLEPMLHDFIELTLQERQGIENKVQEIWATLHHFQAMGADATIKTFQDMGFTKRDEYLLKFFNAEATIPEIIKEYNLYQTKVKLASNKEAVMNLLRMYLEEQQVQDIISDLEYSSKPMAGQILKALNINDDFIIDGMHYKVEVNKNKDSVYGAKDIQKIIDDANKVASGEIQIGTFKSKGAVRLSVEELN